MDDLIKLLKIVPIINKRDMPEIIQNLLAEHKIGVDMIKCCLNKLNEMCDRKDHKDDVTTLSFYTIDYARNKVMIIRLNENKCLECNCTKQYNHICTKQYNHICPKSKRVVLKKLDENTLDIRMRANSFVIKMLQKIQKYNKQITNRLLNVMKCILILLFLDTNK